MKTSARSTKQRARAKPKPAEPQPLSEQAYGAIKQRIITLEYRPGQYLNESAICTDLGFTRMPVHQALHRLQLEGLVDIIPRKGVIVRADSLNEMLDLMDTRLLVEPHCSALASERATKSQIEQLQEILNVSRSKMTRETMDEFMALDQSFHRALIVAARNRVLGEVVTSLHERSARIWYLHFWSDDDLHRTQLEHEDVLKAVVGADPEAAQAAMHRHIMSLRRRMARITEG